MKPLPPACPAWIHGLGKNRQNNWQTRPFTVLMSPACRLVRHRAGHHISTKGELLMRRSIAVLVAVAFVGMSSFAVADDMGLGQMSEGMKQDMSGLSNDLSAQKEDLASDLKAKKESVKSEMKAKRDEAKAKKKQAKADLKAKKEHMKAKVKAKKDAARAKAAEARSVADDAAHEAGGMKNDVTGVMRN
jgi:hypothetical protein